MFGPGLRLGVDPPPARMHADVAVAHRASGFEAGADAEAVERMHGIRLDEVVADLLVVIGAGLTFDERDLEALPAEERGGRAAGRARAHDYDVVLCVTCHA